LNVDVEIQRRGLAVALDLTNITLPVGSDVMDEGQTRQKRVLPSRSRRGGPGVGSCDIDIMILDTQKRKGLTVVSLHFGFADSRVLDENEPMIPTETPFLLTTDSTLVSSSTTNVPLNRNANERYFDRPEVLKAYKEQQIIQTPEFTPLSVAGSVGGRFRPRGGEDVSPSCFVPCISVTYVVPEILSKMHRQSSQLRTLLMQHTKNDTANLKLLKNDSGCVKKNNLNTSNTN
jgi:hypothetical protein